MTSTPQDDALESEVIAALGSGMRAIAGSNKKVYPSQGIEGIIFLEQVKSVMKLITAQKEVWQREARIDELTAMHETYKNEHYWLYLEADRYVEDRINELKKRGIEYE